MKSGMKARKNTKCPSCGSTQAHRVWLWVKGLMYLREVELALSLSTNKYVLRVVRRQLFASGKGAYRFDDGKDYSRVRLTIEQVKDLRDQCDFWLGEIK